MKTNSFKNILISLRSCSNFGAVEELVANLKKKVHIVKIIKFMFSADDIGSSQFDKQVQSGDYSCWSKVLDNILLCVGESSVLKEKIKYFRDELFNLGKVLKILHKTHKFKKVEESARNYQYVIDLLSSVIKAFEDEKRKENGFHFSDKIIPVLEAIKGKLILFRPAALNDFTKNNNNELQFEFSDLPGGINNNKK